MKKSPPGTLTTLQALERLGLSSRQAFYQSGLADKIDKWEPFGTRYPLWDARNVDEWSDYLRQRRGLVALGKLPDNAPLIEADANPFFGDGREDIDWVCERCGLDTAVAPDRDRDGELAGPYWCPKCGIVAE
jgi:hypothetical protein